jgi:hypothetical protein
VNRRSFIFIFLAISLSHLNLMAQQDWDPAADSNYNMLLDRAIHWQNRADSLYHLSVQWRKEAGSMIDPLEKGRLQSRIVIVEDSLAVFRARADSSFSSLLSPSAPFIIPDTVIDGITVYRYNLEHEYFNTPVPAEAESDTITSFHIYPSSVYNGENPVESGYEIPPGSFYRIQLAVFSKEIPHDHFGGLFPITTEMIEEKELTRFFVGRFSKLDEAERALGRVKSAGYPDAYIVGYYDGVKSTLEKVRTLEKD